MGIYSLLYNSIVTHRFLLPQCFTTPFLILPYSQEMLCSLKSQGIEIANMKGLRFDADVALCTTHWMLQSSKTANLTGQFSAI